MEKLMKYVEEMQKEWINICRPQFQQYDLVHMVLISKSYWLIKWLVENNKIDLDNEELISLMSELRERRNPTKCLLMLLSIQDEPIRFLCEMLKDG